MKITTIGRGSIGGTLARLWTAAGHQVDAAGPRRRRRVRRGGRPGGRAPRRHPGSAGRRDRPGGQDRHRGQQPTRRRGAAPRATHPTPSTSRRSLEAQLPRRSTSTSASCWKALLRRPTGPTTSGSATRRPGRPSSSSRATPACGRATPGHWTAPTLRRPSPRCSWRSSMTPMPACSTTASPRQKQM